MQFYEINICLVMIFRLYAVYNNHDVIKSGNKIRKKSQALSQVLKKFWCRHYLLTRKVGRPSQSSENPSQSFYFRMLFLIIIYNIKQPLSAFAFIVFSTVVLIPFNFPKEHNYLKSISLYWEQNSSLIYETFNCFDNSTLLQLIYSRIISMHFHPK